VLEPAVDEPSFGCRYRAGFVVELEDGLRLGLVASPSLRNLHLCMPASRAVFCVEPVSHVPGVVNRRAFAHLGDMTALAPGEALEGTVVLSPERLPHQAA
jgi:aldose 1-epimerase